MPNQQPVDKVRQSREEAIEFFRKKAVAMREEYEFQHAELLETIRILEGQIKSSGSETPSAQGPAASTGKVPPVRPESYSGMTKFEALVEFLRKYPRLQPVSVSEIRKGLLAGGAVLSKKIRGGMGRAKSEEATLLTTAHNHPDVLERDKTARTIWLLEPDYKFRRSRKGRQ